MSDSKSDSGANGKGTRRRLALMPEVLPTPQRSNDLPLTSVRARTLARLRVLAAIGAGVAAACSGKTESGGTGSSSSSGGGGDGGLPNNNRPDANDPYGVVDPLPSPACFSYQTPPTATASYTDLADAGVDGGAGATPTSHYVRLAITWNQSGVVAGDITPESDTVVIDHKATVDGIELVLRRETALGTTQVGIETSCPKGPTRLQVSIVAKGDDLQTSVSFYGH